MDEKKLKEIEKSAEEIIEDFVEAAENLPPTKEMYYSQETFNITRPDGEPTETHKLAGFRERFRSIMPKSDEEGNLKVEVAKWAER